MAGADVTRAAGEALWHELLPGERIVGSARVASDPPRWALAAYLALSVALMAAGLVQIFGAWPNAGAGPGSFLAPLLPLAVVAFLPRPLLVVVTSQRLIGLRLSRLQRAPRQVVFAAPLAEVRVVRYRQRRYAISVLCEIPGHRRIRLSAGRSGRTDLAEVEEALLRAGAFREFDPPWPAGASRVSCIPGFV